MKHPLPLSLPIGERPSITQPYGDKSSVEWYKQNGLNLEYHNGVDLVVGDSLLTYGTKIVCPVPEAELSAIWWDSPMSTTGNGIQIAWEKDLDRYNMRAWHCSKVVTKPKYLAGDVIGYIGNSGLVRPAPTAHKPYQGSHLHLMVYKNGVLIDPMSVFDANRWFTSNDTGVEFDVAPLQWAIEKLGLKGIIDKILYVLSVIRIK